MWGLGIPSTVHRLQRTITEAAARGLEPGGPSRGHEHVGGRLREVVRARPGGLSGPADGGRGRSRGRGLHRQRVVHDVVWKAAHAQTPELKILANPRDQCA